MQVHSGFLSNDLLSEAQNTLSPGQTAVKNTGKPEVLGSCYFTQCTDCTQGK